MRALNEENKNEKKNTKLSTDYHTILNDPSKNVSITLTWNLNNRKCRLHTTSQRNNKKKTQWHYKFYAHTSHHIQVSSVHSIWNTKRERSRWFHNKCIKAHINSDFNRIEMFAGKNFLGMIVCECDCDLISYSAIHRPGKWSLSWIRTCYIPMHNLWCACSLCYESTFDLSIDHLNVAPYYLHLCQKNILKLSSLRSKSKYLLSEITHHLDASYYFQLNSKNEQTDWQIERLGWHGERKKDRDSVRERERQRVREN